MTWSYYRGSRVFDIKVGYTCNNACIHCIVDPVRRRLKGERKREDLDTRQVEELIARAVASGRSTVVITGGEVTIRPDCERLLRCAAKHGLKIVLQTNGRMLSQGDLCERLASIPDVLYMISLHGSRSEIHDAVTQRGGSFSETSAAIRNLREYGQNVLVKIVLLPHNRGDIFATATHAIRLGVRRICIVFPHAAEFTKDRFKIAILRYSDFHDDLKAIDGLRAKNGVYVSFENIPYCVVSSMPGIWSRNCDLRSLTASRTTSQDEQTDMFDWEKFRQTMKEKRPTCRRCVFDHICEGPWREYVEEYGFDEFVPVEMDMMQPYMAVESG